MFKVYQKVLKITRQIIVHNQLGHKIEVGDFIPSPPHKERIQVHICNKHLGYVVVYLPPVQNVGVQIPKVQRGHLFSGIRVKKSS